MASPQVEDGFTRIANELLEALMRVNITSREFRVMLCLIRNSYGRGSKKVSISYGEIGIQTGIRRQNVAATITKLSLTGMTTVIDGDDRLEKSKKTFEINKNYESWKSNLSLTGMTDTKRQTVIDGDDRSVIDGDDSQKILPFIQKKKEIKKINKRKIRRESDFNNFWSEYPLKVAKKQAMKTWDKLAKIPQDDNDALPPIEKLISALKAQKRQKQQKRESGEFCPEWKHPSTWLNAGCWDDETECEECDDDYRSRLERIARRVIEGDSSTGPSE